MTEEKGCMEPVQVEDQEAAIRQFAERNTFLSRKAVCRWEQEGKVFVQPSDGAEVLRVFCPTGVDAAQAMVLVFSHIKAVHWKLKPGARMQIDAEQAA